MNSIKLITYNMSVTIPQQHPERDSLNYQLLMMEQAYVLQYAFQTCEDEANKVDQAH